MSRSPPAEKPRPAPVITAIEVSGSAATSRHTSAELAVHALVGRVESLGPVHGDEQHAGRGALEQQVLVVLVHGGPLGSCGGQGIPTRYCRLDLTQFSLTDRSALHGRSAHDQANGSTTRSPSSPAADAASAAPPRWPSPNWAPRCASRHAPRNRSRRSRASCARSGAEALAVTADVGVRADVERLFATAVDTFGQVDIMVNNAGLVPDRPDQ